MHHFTSPLTPLVIPPPYSPTPPPSLTFTPSFPCRNQRLLDLEIDDSPIYGAPLVVLKHALIALPNDIPFACQLHSRCVEVSPSLGAMVKETLIDYFSDNCQLWTYLASYCYEDNAGMLLMTHESHEILLAEELGTEQDDRNNASSGSKRKSSSRTNKDNSTASSSSIATSAPSATSIVSFVVKSMETCLAVLTTAKEKILEGNDEKMTK